MHMFNWYYRLLSSIYISAFFIRTSFAMMVVAFPIYLSNVKGYAIFGILVSSSPFFELITVMGIATLIDKYGRRETLIYGLLLGAIALFMLFVSKNVFYIFFVNALHGIAAAAILVASLALLADYSDKKHVGREMGMFDGANVAGWGVGFGLGGLLIDIYKNNIGYIFIIAGILALIGLIYSFINVTEPRKKSFVGNELSFKHISNVLMQKSVLLLTIPWFIIYLLVGT
ncbi:MAG: MFS transporter, partial [Candidatus Thermoplasmatota archaeon]